VPSGSNEPEASKETVKGVLPDRGFADAITIGGLLPVPGVFVEVGVGEIDPVNWTGS
jgi:hypothetical protein